MTKANYGMTNVEIKLEGRIWTVYADTERFGKHEIMAQCISRKEAERWCEANGVDLTPKSAREMAMAEIAKHGKIQIGNVMYRRLYEEDGQIYGHSPSYYGHRNITKMIDACVMVSEYIGKTKEDGRGRTVKFGKACTF